METTPTAEIIDTLTKKGILTGLVLETSHNPLLAVAAMRVAMDMAVDEAMDLAGGGCGGGARLPRVPPAARFPRATEFCSCARPARVLHASKSTR